MHDKNCFLTLTYDNKHLPYDGSLNVRHWQLFAKKLRKSYGPFRFFHCGEYGDINGRPHYHAAIFGLDFFKGREFHSNGKTGEPLYTNPKLTKLWGQGLAVIGGLSFQSAAYVARYIMKKQTGPPADAHYASFDPKTGEYLCQLKPEYVTMSRKPGIGTAWIEKYLDEVYPDDEIIINGKTARPPKFYDQYLETKNPNAFEKLRKKRALSGIANQSENTPDRLLVREQCSAAKSKQTTRTL